jgi:hypothetical protein
MTKKQIDDLATDIAEVMKIVEPWLQQLLKFNPEEKYLGPVRDEAAKKLATLMSEVRRVN